MCCPQSHGAPSSPGWRANAEVLEAELRRSPFLASTSWRFTGSAGHWKAASKSLIAQRLGLSAVGGDGALQHFGFPQWSPWDSTCLT